MQQTENGKYSGDELDVFAGAVNWKSYWTAEISPFLGRDLLEIGAGIGSTLKALCDHPFDKWVAVEPDGGLCAIMRSEQQKGTLPQSIEVRNGTLVDLDSNELFDTILYVDVLEHIEDDREELLRAERHLVRGGKVVVIVPAHSFLYSEFDKQIGHFRRYNKSMMHSVAPEGLKIRKMRYLDSVGLLASLVSKLLLRSGWPTKAQVQLWDRFMVPLSRRVMDRLLGYQVGKSIVCVLEK